MGRSGGGFHSGGGGSFHSSGSSFHSSYHSSSHHHYSSSGGGECDACSCLLFTVGVIVICCVAALIYMFDVVVSSNEVVGDFVVSDCEQVVVCPEGVQDNVISFSSKSNSVPAYLVKKLPPLSEEVHHVNFTVPGQYVASYAYIHRSFNLVEGSRLSCKITGDSRFRALVIRGYDNFDSFVNGYSYDYVWSNTGSSIVVDLPIKIDGEYFVVADGYYGGVRIYDIPYSIDYTRYEVEGNIEKTCTSTCDFVLDEGYIPGACIIVEKLCESSGTDTQIYISYLVPRDTEYYVCLVILILIFGSIVVAILALVLHAMCGKMRRGRVIRNIMAGEAPDPTPAVKETQPIVSPAPTSYSTPSSYGTPAYDPVPPAYASVDPSAPPYVPYSATMA